MADRRPLVIDGGEIKEMPAGDLLVSDVLPAGAVIQIDARADLTLPRVAGFGRHDWLVLTLADVPVNIAGGDQIIAEGP